MKAIHGGDIYRNHVTMDFSVNINPLGIPTGVQEALHRSVAMCESYPDITAQKLREEMAKMLNVPEEYFIFGNGASEIFMAIVHAVCPKKTVIPVPSFYGYEYAANAANGEIIFTEDWEDIDEDADVVFLANPNNPTGVLRDKKEIWKLLEACKASHTLVVLDECFIEFCDPSDSMLSELEQYPNLILVRAFTKIFAIPGVRLGYLMCSNQELNAQIRRHLPEWNLSAFAEMAGVACTKEQDFVRQTRKVVEQERAYLTTALQNFGFHVQEGRGNFILFYTENPMYELLLARGILIRDCSNFRGLRKGYYRIAVKNRQENERLLKEIGEIIERD